MNKPIKRKKIKAFMAIWDCSELPDSWDDIRTTRQEALMVAAWREGNRMKGKYKVVPVEISFPARGKPKKDK